MGDGKNDGRQPGRAAGERPDQSSRSPAGRPTPAASLRLGEQNTRATRGTRLGVAIASRTAHSRRREPHRRARHSQNPRSMLPELERSRHCAAGPPGTRSAQGHPGNRSREQDHRGGERPLDQQDVRRRGGGPHPAPDRLTREITARLPVPPGTSCRLSRCR
jgi:hypothetical protein